MNYTKIVTDAAKALNLLDDKGALISLDSLTVLDLVNELERVAEVSIPTSEIQAETFSSLDAIVALLKKLKP